MPHNINSRLKSAARRSAVCCTAIHSHLQQSFNTIGKKMAKWGISANWVSIMGFMVGIFAINFLAMEMYFYALLCILGNRLFDALDGAIARHSKVTDFGTFLDACLDYVFYAGVILGFALADPAQNALSACFLLFAFTASSCSLLAYAVVAYKNNKAKKLELNQSPFYLGGLAQGFETLIALVILCIMPELFMPIAILLGVLCLIKAMSVLVSAYYSFIIAKK